MQGQAEPHARTVVEEGWLLMQGVRVSATAGAISAGASARRPGRRARAEGETDLYAQAPTLVGELDQNRALRLLEVREGIPSIPWVVLSLGGATTVCFACPLGVLGRGSSTGS